jgi:hypothetical protein
MNLAVSSFDSESSMPSTSAPSEIKPNHIDNDTFYSEKHVRNFYSRESQIFEIKIKIISKRAFVMIQYVKLS